MLSELPSSHRQSPLPREGDGSKRTACIETAATCVRLAISLGLGCSRPKAGIVHAPKLSPFFQMPTSNGKRETSSYSAWRAFFVSLEDGSLWSDQRTYLTISMRGAWDWRELQPDVDKVALLSSVEIVSRVLGLIARNERPRHAIANWSGRRVQTHARSNGDFP